MWYDNTNKWAIWIRKARSWLMYKSWTLNVQGTEYKITMFDNQHKQNENHPDFNIIVELVANDPIPENNKSMIQTDITKPKNKTWQEQEQEKFWDSWEISIDWIPF